MIGGALAKPVETMPSVFPPGCIFDRLPYLLPNLFSACCVFIGVVIGVLFLEETHAKKKLRRDPGLELGNSLLTRLQTAFIRKSKGKAPEEQCLLGDSDEPLPGYSSTKTSASTSAESDLAIRECTDMEGGRPVPPRVEKSLSTFNKTTVLIIITFGILAL